MLNRRHFLAGLATAPVLANPARANSPMVYAKGGYAIGGYDPVAYFHDGAPRAGLQAHKLMWRNAIWQFASETNQAAFERHPHAYAPQYGGFCAMSLTEGNLSESVPEAWVIYEDKLYLTHSVHARDRWVQSPEAFVVRADAHWPDVLCR